MLTEFEKKIFKRLMDDYSNRLSNSICNDFELENSPEVVDFIRDVERICGVKEEDISVINPDREHVYAMDWMILYYLCKKLGV
jgi:hypothetical protein